MADRVVTETTEVTRTTPEVEVVTVRTRPSFLARMIQLIDYLFWLLYTLLFIRLLLVFFSANPAAGFAQFIDNVTDPFFTPFRGIVANLTVGGQYVLSIPILIAMLVYGLLHLAINKLLWVVASRQTAD